MSEYVAVGERQYHLNDILVEIPYFEVGFEFEFNGEKYLTRPQQALEYALEYTMEGYTERAVNGARSPEALLEFIEETSAVIKLLGA